MDKFLEEFNQTCINTAKLPLVNIFPQHIGLMILVHKGVISKEELLAIQEFYNNNSRIGKIV